jgi:1-acyl-sn-glycerol-3-phosphate acyltransferase
MAYLRVIAICLALLVVLLVAVPLQWSAVRFGWPSRSLVPTTCCRLLAKILRMKVTAHGTPVRAGARLLAANHVSWLDILALNSVEPLCFLAKKEVASWPVVSTFVRLQETVLIDRKRRRAIPGANATMARRMLDGHGMLLFPEGTTGDGLSLKKFHSSHFASARDLLAGASDIERVTVQPVAIRYSTRAAAWHGDATLLPHVWSLLNGAPISCDLVFGAPITYLRETNRKTIAGEVAMRVATMLANLAQEPSSCGPEMMPLPDAAVMEAAE